MNERAEKLVSDLIDEWHRCDEVLSRPTVDRLMLKRDLNPDECLYVESQLKENGIEIEEPQDLALEKISDEELSSQAQFSSNLTALDLFMKDLKKYPLLTKEDEVKLGRQIGLGRQVQEKIDSGEVSDIKEFKDILVRAKHARDKMTVSNLRLVIWVATKFKNRTNMDFSDVINEGTFGLMKATERFDVSYDVKFSTYATWWIRQAILRGIDDKEGLIRIPVHAKEKVRKVKRAVQFLKMRNGSEPTVTQIADLLTWDKDQVAFLYDLAKSRVVSIDQPTSEENDLTIGDLLPSNDPGPYKLHEQTELREKIGELLSYLDDTRLQDVMDRRFGVSSGTDETLESIGQDYNITRERIRQLENKGLSRVRKKAKRNKLKIYLEGDN